MIRRLRPLSIVALSAFHLLFAVQIAVAQPQPTNDQFPFDVCSSFVKMAEKNSSRYQDFGPELFQSSHISADCEAKIYKTEAHLVDSAKFTPEYVRNLFEIPFVDSVCSRRDMWDFAFDHGWKTEMTIYSHDDLPLWSLTIGACDNSD